MIYDAKAQAIAQGIYKPPNSVVNPKLQNQIATNKVITQETQTKTIAATGTGTYGGYVTPVTHTFIALPTWWSVEDWFIIFASIILIVIAVVFLIVR